MPRVLVGQLVPDVPCYVQAPDGSWFIHDPERPDRLAAVGLTITASGRLASL